MRKVKEHLVDYHRKYFDWRLYLSVALFLGVAIAINYYLDFEDTYIDQYHGQPIIWFWMFLFQLFPYLVVYLILLVFGKVNNWTSNADFWVRLLLGFGVLAVNRSQIGTDQLISLLGQEGVYFVIKCLRSSLSLLTIVLPLMMIYYFKEKQDQPKIWYGLSMRKFDVKPYVAILLFMSFVIGSASFLPDIQEHYPRFLHVGLNSFIKETQWPRWLSVLVYEFCYGSNFISVELFFRGYLIFAFVRILGPYVVLPMAASYCFLHFGKPAGEAISSIFGGYVLGIISLNTRNIWGGVLIHLGVAWLMELFGWLQTFR